MGDPILGIKWFCLGLVVLVVLWISYVFAKGWRVSFGKTRLLASKTETVLLIMVVVDTILCIVCLGWSALVWIIN